MRNQCLFPHGFPYLKQCDYTTFIIVQSQKKRKSQSMRAICCITAKHLHYHPSWFNNKQLLFTIHIKYTTCSIASTDITITTTPSLPTMHSQQLRLSTRIGPRRKESGLRSSTVSPAALRVGGVDTDHSGGTGISPTVYPGAHTQRTHTQRCAAPTPTPAFLSWLLLQASPPVHFAFHSEALSSMSAYYPSFWTLRTLFT